MSRTRLDKSQNDSSQDSPAEPIVESPVPAAVEKQQALHDAPLNNPQAALQPGKPFSASEDLLGELATMIHNAEKDGNQSLSAELQSVVMKIGELNVHLSELEKTASEKVKPIYLKVISFFKK